MLHTRYDIGHSYQATHRADSTFATALRAAKGPRPPMCSCRTQERPAFPGYSCSGSYQALPIQSLDGGHNREKDSNSQNEETSGGRRLRRLSRAAEPPLNGLKAGSPGGSPYPSPGEEMSHEAHLRKTGGRQRRRNEADTQTRSSLCHRASSTSTTTSTRTIWLRTSA
jgi:hypothetical protein